MSRRTTRARLLGTFSFFFTSCPDKEKKRLTRRRRVVQSLFPSSHSPQTARRCRSLPSGGTPPCVVPFLGEEEGKKGEKKMGAFLLPHPWADDDDDDASPPHPSLPPSLFFLLLLRSVRTQRESLYTVSGFPSSPFFCFCCCLYLLPSLYLSCWSIVSLFFVFCA